MSVLSLNDLCWYAMAATFKREMKIKKILDDLNIENFIPMSYKYVIKNGKKEKKMLPLIHNLVFVKSSMIEIQQIKRKYKYLQFLTNKIENKNVPIVVPEKQMKDFIRAVNVYDDKSEVLNYNEIKIKKGSRVRIIGGPFDGQEGIFTKVNNHRSRSVVVSIKGVAAVCINSISPSMIQVIDKK